MKNTLQEQTSIVQQLSAEVEQAKNHFMLKNAVKPLALVLSFMRNVVRTAIEQEKRLAKLEQQAGVSHG